MRFFYPIAFILGMACSPKVKTVYIHENQEKKESTKPRVVKDYEPRYVPQPAVPVITPSSPVIATPLPLPKVQPTLEIHIKTDSPKEFPAAKWSNDLGEDWHEFNELAKRTHGYVIPITDVASIWAIADEIVHFLRLADDEVFQTAWVLDSTQSMRKNLITLKSSLSNLPTNSALITFKDHLDYYPAQILLDFNSGRELFNERLSELEGSGGGDIPESPLDGLLLARNLSWQPESHKIIFLVTDAKPQMTDARGEISFVDIRSQLQGNGRNNHMVVIFVIQ